VASSRQLVPTGRACVSCCCADLTPCEAALAFGSDYDLERDDALWPRPGLGVSVK